MANDTLVNGLSPVTSGSNGVLVTGPDVCQTTIGPAVVPIPYTNIAKSADLAGGSGSVFVNGNPVCLDNSTFSTSVGDEGGDKKGNSSGTINGEAAPQSSSGTVFIEGKAVVRNTDMFVSNTENTPPAPVQQAQLSNGPVNVHNATLNPFTQYFRFNLIDDGGANSLFHLMGQRGGFLVRNADTHEVLLPQKRLLEETIGITRVCTAESQPLEAIIDYGEGFDRVESKSKAIPLPEMKVEKKKRPTLRPGDRNEHVKDLQRAINQVLKPNPPIATDGIYGKNTERYARKLQDHFSLGIDGIIGKRTWKMIDRLEAGEAEAEMAAANDPGKKQAEGEATDWFTIAEKEKGQKEDKASGKHNPRIVEYHSTTTLKAKDDETPWCSSFVNWVMIQAGYKGTNSAAAASWVEWGEKSEAKKGAITVIYNKKMANSTMSTSGNHVGFLVEENDRFYVLLGGNQRDQVKLSRYPKSSWALKGYRWPEEKQKVTAAMLDKIFTGKSVQDTDLAVIADEINNSMDKVKLDSKLRVMHFFAQVREEVGTNLTISENLNYSEGALKALFSYYRRNPDKAALHAYEKNAAGKITRKANQEAIANGAYADRNGNGDVASGDGWRYRGRGMKQLTGKSNYAAFTKKHNEIWGEDVDFVKNPDLLLEMKYAVRSAMSFWYLNGLYSKADGGESRAAADSVTAIVNRGTDSYERRYNHFVKIKSDKVFDEVDFD